MTRSERLLAILQHLREMRAPVTAHTLGERFGVSERTIYRDVETLAARGAIIASEAGVGYELRDGFFLPPLHSTSKKRPQSCWGSASSIDAATRP